MLDIAGALIARGTEVDARDETGCTPLHIAATCKYSTHVARLLIEKGADGDARDEEGRTPLHWAAVHNYFETARLLIEKGANTEGIDLSWMDDQEDGS